LSNLNRIILIGRLTADPEVRLTVDGVPMARFTLAVDRPDSGDKASRADFITCVAWRSAAETVQNSLKKGMLALVEGRIASRSYETDSGQRRYVTEVEAGLTKSLNNGSSITTSENEVGDMFMNLESVTQQASNLEEKANEQVAESEFDFGDTENPTGLEFPPSFGEEVMEDVPF
jgi:single stranded DNA-binding protein